MDRNSRPNGVLLALFVGSGCSALIYEIVWFQQLTLILGATAISLAILLTSFMGGMCLGSLVFPRLITNRRNPLVVYACLELLIAVCGLAVLHLLPIVGHLYWSMANGSTHDLWLRSTVSLVLLLPPTVLMGATLPAISRWLECSRHGMSQLGVFYSANTFGAVLGSLLSGLYLLRLYDVAVATYVAAAINLAVAAVAVWVARRTPLQRAAESNSTVLPTDRFRLSVVSTVVCLSGMTALGSEVVWTRLLGLLLGPTAYTFSIVLAVFLLGLGIGSSLGASLSRRVRSPGWTLALCQIFQLAAIPYAAFIITNVVPFWLSSHGVDQIAWVRMGLDVVRTFVALFPATCLWGATFPLAAATALDGQSDNGRLVGGLYSANTLGAIGGALGMTLVAYPALGSHLAQQILTGVAGIAGLVMAGYMLLVHREPADFGMPFRRLNRRTIQYAGGPLIIMACVAGPAIVPAVPRGLLAYGHAVELWNSIHEYLFVSEGVDSTIVVATSTFGNRCFHISGKIEATTSVADMRTQRMLGHLPGLAHHSPRKVLVVGCGSGMTAGSFLLYPSVERVVICEMESSVIKASRENFAIQNYRVLEDRRTQIIVDDARHFLATTKEKFDVITTDPIHPWVRGAAALYTTEFLQMCRDHLNPGGVVAQWVPLYESNVPAVKCELATFLDVFPFATIWSGESRSKGYDVIAIGTDGSSLEPQQLVRRVSSNPAVIQSLIEVELNSQHMLESMFAAYGSDLREWLRDAQINRDRNLRLQYLAGMNPDGKVSQSLIEVISRQRPVPSQVLSAVQPSTED